MGKWMTRLLPIALVCWVAMAACLGGDDGGSGPTGPESADPAQDDTGQGGLLAEVLLRSLQEAFFASLINDPTTVPGQSGELRIEGNAWTFVEYSADGELFVDGALVVEKDKYPNIPARGSLLLSGSTEGTLLVDIVVRVVGMATEASGTLTLGDQVWDMAELMAAAEE